MEVEWFRNKSFAFLLTLKSKVWNKGQYHGFLSLGCAIEAIFLANKTKRFFIYFWNPLSIFEGSHNTWNFWRGKGHELKKAWKSLQCIEALPFLAILMLGRVKNVSFWVIQKSMNFEINRVENVWCSRAFIIFSAKV